MSERVEPNESFLAALNAARTLDPLEFKSAEQRLLEQIRRWAPLSGYGEQTVRLEYQGGQIVRVVRLNSEESVKL